MEPEQELALDLAPDMAQGLGLAPGLVLDRGPVQELASVLVRDMEQGPGLGLGLALAWALAWALGLALALGQVRGLLVAAVEELVQAPRLLLSVPALVVLMMMGSDDGGNPGRQASPTSWTSWSGTSVGGSCALRAVRPCRHPRRLLRPHQSPHRTPKSC